MTERSAAEPDPFADQAGVEVRRSTRRRRTVSAYRDGDRTVVLIPAKFSKSDEERWVAAMMAKLDARDRRAERRSGDDELAARARALSDEHLDGQADPASVRWVDNMRSRWGSCTPRDGTIRISKTLQTMPPWVLDYVLVHELAHLLQEGHDERFWALVARYPRTERARGYLEGVIAAARLGITDNDVETQPLAAEGPDAPQPAPRPGPRRWADSGPAQPDLDSLLDRPDVGDR